MNIHYYNRYLRFIESCRSDTTVYDYTEDHHIVPKSLGGTDNLDNIIKLSARQHFIAHLLLWKTHMTFGMAKAFYMMANVNSDKHTGRKFKINSRIFETLRKHRSEEQTKLNKIRWNDPEWSAKQREILRRAATTPEERVRRRLNAIKVNELYKEQKSALMKANWKDPEWAANRKKKLVEGSTKRKPIIVDGIEYDKAEDVAEAYSITKPGVRYRINSASFPGWTYK